VREALDIIAAATAQLCDREESNVLKISVLPTFAVRWLIPRLGEFQNSRPEIDLRISSSYRAVDFAREDFDAAVRYGTGNWPDLHVTPVFEEELIPVCSPKLLPRSGKVFRPEDLEEFTLIHSGTCTDNWRQWLSAVGARNVDPSAGMTFDTCLLSFQAACEGLGFAIANRSYVERDLLEGRLVAPFDYEFPNNHGWHLVCSKARADLPKITAFREWLTNPVRC
jgi:LysR family glycine cleavage system transcriptional activator